MTDLIQFTIHAAALSLVLETGEKGGASETRWKLVSCVMLCGAADFLNTRLVLPALSASVVPGSGSVTYLLFFPLCSFASISAWAIDSSAWVMASFACCSASLACASPVPLMDSSM